MCCVEYNVLQKIKKKKKFESSIEFSDQTLYNQISLKSCKIGFKRKPIKKAEVYTNVAVFFPYFWEMNSLQNFVKICFDITPSSCVNYYFTRANAFSFLGVFINNSGYHNENFQMPSGGSKSHFYHGYLTLTNKRKRKPNLILNVTRNLTCVYKYINVNPPTFEYTIDLQMVLMMCFESYDEFLFLSLWCFDLR